MSLLFSYTYGKIARVHAKTIEELVFMIAEVFGRILTERI